LDLPPTFSSDDEDETSEEDILSDREQILEDMTRRTLSKSVSSAVPDLHKVKSDIESQSEVRRQKIRAKQAEKTAMVSLKFYFY